MLNCEDGKDVGYFDAELQLTTAFAGASKSVWTDYIYFWLQTTQNGCCFWGQGGEGRVATCNSSIGDYGTWTNTMQRSINLGVWISRCCKGYKIRSGCHCVTVAPYRIISSSQRNNCAHSIMSATAKKNNGCHWQTQELFANLGGLVVVNATELK